MPHTPRKRPARTHRTLRQRAEASLHMTSQACAEMPVHDLQRLVHELQIHQSELEMQNDALRRTESALKAARNRYADLYDFAPVGISASMPTGLSWRPI
jgi:hypothetical protein